ncbi:kinase-like domain-containing protein [Haematococcus lacustris]
MAQPPPEDKLRRAQALLMGTHYVPKAILGEGAFGLVVLAQDSRVNNYRAVKLIQRQGQHMQLLRREIKLHWSMDHPHIVRMREVFRAGTTHVGIAMDACTAGSLLDYLETHGHSHAGRKPSEVQGPPVAWGLKEGMARWFLQQLVLALEYCHAKEVVHRDIKLENVLLESVQGVPLPLVRLADFGLSRRHNAENPCVTHVGTPAYLAPELLQLWLENGSLPLTHTGPQAYDGTKVDVWALGVLLYTLLFHRYPFGSPSSAHLQQAAQAGLGAARVPVTARGTAADNPMDNIRRLLAADVRYPDPPTAGGQPVSSDCMALLKSMLQRDPDKRLSLAGIMATPWFRVLLPEGAIDMTRNQLDRERQWAQDGVLHMHLQPLQEVVDVIMNPVAGPQRLVTTGVTR